MEEFIENKEREAVDMYTNAFLKIIANFIYAEIASLNDKNAKKIKKMYAILLKYVLP